MPLRSRLLWSRRVGRWLFTLSGARVIVQLDGCDLGLLDDHLSVLALLGIYARLLLYSMICDDRLSLSWFVAMARLLLVT
eukprot:scaffold25166_cov79-Cyclotella_meneghiniana.AAC.2